MYRRRARSRVPYLLLGDRGDARQGGRRFAGQVRPSGQRVVKGIVEALQTVLVIKDPFIRFEALKRVDALAPLLTENYVNRKLFALLLGLAIRMMLAWR